MAAPGFFAGRPLPTSPEELSGLPAIDNEVYPDREVWRLLRGEEMRSVPVLPVVTTGCPETLLRLVRAGLGIGQFGEYQVLDDLQTGRLVRLLPDWAVAEVPVLAVYPDNRQIAAKVRAFIDFPAKRLPDHITVHLPAPAPSVDEKAKRVGQSSDAVATTEAFCAGKEERPQSPSLARRDCRPILR